MTLTYFDSIVLGIVEGLTEFLPVSSTGHLTVAEKLLGLKVDDKAVTAYTAIIQLGAIAATLIFFARKIVRLARAWVAGLRRHDEREGDYLLAWAVIVGSIPVGLVGFALKDVIEGPLRSLWVVAAALVLWSGVIVWAERRHDVLARRGRQRSDEEVTIGDAIVIGLVQCFSLIPGVSRSGATISAGLARGIDRVSATELSFFMAIPALTAAGAFEAAKTDLSGLGTGQLATGIVIAFVVAYASIAWLLRFVAHHTIAWFVPYRVGLGVLLLVLLGAGVLSPT